MTELEGEPPIEDRTSPMAVVQHYYTNPGPKMSPEGNVSKLSLMQARFQQRQQQEKEQKLLQLYTEQAQQAYARVGVGPAGGSGGGGGGKVRQLFQERRGGGGSTKQGLDRSYPLQPLESRRATSLDRSHQQRNKRPANLYKGTPPRYPSAGYEGDDDYFYQPQNNNIIYTSQQRIDQDFIDYHQKSNGYKQKQVFNDENDFLPRSYDLDSTKIFKKLPNIGGALLTEQKAMMAPAKEPELKKPAPLAARTKPNDPAVRSVTKAMSKLSTTKKPEVKVTPSKIAASPSTNSTDSKPSSRVGVRRPTPVPSNKANGFGSRPSSASNNVATQEPVKSRVEPVKSTAIKPAVRPSPSKTSSVAPSSTRNDLIPCDNCGRNFAKDRIDAHRNICLKTSKKKRKPFDPTKQRLKGTGAESYLKKGKTVTPPQVTAKKNNWRKKHEEFINNIRAAKIAQAHIAAGGKISDLPPPPPSDTSDYVQCPHCSRKFNEGAASRHIPKCANMLHNKPKPVPSQNRMLAAKKRTR